MNILYNAKEKHFYCEELPTLYFSSKILEEKVLRERMQIILVNLLKHKEALDFVKLQLASGAITVDFDLHENIMSFASWHRITRTIRIATNRLSSFEILNSFIFEMCNAGNKGFQEIRLETCKDENEYATATENCEYNSGLQCAIFTLKGLEDYHWPKEEDSIKNCYERLKRTSEECLILQKTNALQCLGFSHFEIYVLAYLKNKKGEIIEQRLKIMQEKLDWHTKSSSLTLELCAEIRPSLINFSFPYSISTKDPKRKNELELQLKETNSKFSEVSELLTDVESQKKMIEEKIRLLQENAAKEKLRLEAEEKEVKEKKEKLSEMERQFKETNRVMGIYSRVQQITHGYTLHMERFNPILIKKSLSTNNENNDLTALEKLCDDIETQNANTKKTECVIS